MDKELAQWNDRMYEKHPTPYYGLAGYVERARLRAIHRLANIKPQDRVLELGCEAGNLLMSLPEHERTVGFDISARALNKARKTFNHAGRDALFVHGDAMEPLPFEKGEFSVIICSEMLEHVTKPRLALEQIHKIATPYTRVILTVPYEKPKLILKKLLTSTGLLRVILPGIEEGLSEWHLQEFSLAKLLGEIDGLFEPIVAKTLLGLHVIASVRKIQSES